MIKPVRDQHTETLDALCLIDQFTEDHPEVRKYFKPSGWKLLDAIYGPRRDLCVVGVSTGRTSMHLPQRCAGPSPISDSPGKKSAFDQTSFQNSNVRSQS